MLTPVILNSLKLEIVEDSSFLQSGYVQVEDGRLYYEVAGEGPPLVMIHAGFLDSRMWDDQFIPYSKNFRVIRYDVRGFGKPDVPRTSYSDCRDLHSLLAHLNVARAFLLGCSNGGRIALDFAVEFPDMEQVLVLVAPGVSGGKPSGPEEERLWEEFDRKMKPQEEAIRENKAADAAEMDVNAWASAQTPVSRRRLLEIAGDNFHVQVENSWKLQASPDPRAFQRLG